MALTKTSQIPHTSASLAVGAGTVAGSGGWLATGYGVTLVGKITNGPTGPTTGAQVFVEVADDSSGTNAAEVVRFTEGDLTASAVNRFVYSFGVGDGGDHPYYRVSFVAPTGQNVTAACTASSTSAI